MTLDDGTERLLQAGDSLRMHWAADEVFDASWRLVRPLSRAGVPMGEALAGMLHERKPRGEVLQRIEVGGQGGSPLCNCELPDGVDAEPMGYYRVGPRTVVRIRDEAGHEVGYEMPHPIRERYTGALAMRVDPVHLPPESVAPSAERL